MNNAIVIMFDSLSYRFIGCYGNDWIKTPNMDRLAREGVLFENCFIEGLPTLPCRRAMFTGRYTLPKEGWVPLSMEDTTIADLCWGRPIDTALIFDSPPMRMPKYGYTRGFDKVYFTHGHEVDHDFYASDPLYHENPEDYIDDNYLKNANAVKGEEVVGPLLSELTNYLKQSQYWTSESDRFVAKTVNRAIQYLKDVDRNKQFFLWIDSFDPHEPWHGPSVYMHKPCPYNPDYKGKDEFLPFMGDIDGLFTDEQIHHIHMLYAEMVTLCDTYLGKLLDTVRELGFEENTLFMMVSDHGEPMGYGADGHGLMRKCRPWPYDELAHAPMLLKAPGIKAGQRIEAFIQSVDVAPTVCEWLGIGIHPEMQGKSLLPLCKGEIKKIHDFAIAGYAKYSWSIITEDWSYIHWLKKEQANTGEKSKASLDFQSDYFVKEMVASSSLAATGAVKERMDVDSAEGRNPFERYKSETSLDGEEQWTCTPGSIAQVPEKDELYDRKLDPYQLKNVSEQYPDKAKELLETLRIFMSDLRAS